jgi:hypothetical protein
MNTILISYDLRAPGRDYTKLWDHLKSYGNWAKPLESVWLIRTTLTAAKVRDAASNYVDQNDKIFAVDMTSSEWASLRIPDDVATWLKSLS